MWVSERASEWIECMYMDGWIPVISLDRQVGSMDECVYVWVNVCIKWMNVCMHVWVSEWEIVWWLNQVYAWLIEQVSKWLNQMSECMCECMHEWIKGVSVCMSEWVNESSEWSHVWMNDTWVSEWIKWMYVWLIDNWVYDEWVNQMHEWINESSECMYEWLIDWISCSISI